MDVVTATAIVNDARKAVDSGGGVAGTGFWGLVKAIKTDPSFERFVDDAAAIDQKAFRNWAFLVVPLWVGTSLMVLATLAGLALVAVAYRVTGTWSGVWLLVGTGVLLVSTHGLAHLVLGRLFGIGFTSWFIGDIRQPQPGVKTDYSTYLRVAPAKRAWMHAAGALTTKAIPFLMVGAALAADVPGWAVSALFLIGAVAIATDVLWSTGSSDWKKYRREKALAQPS